jgi:hypothetical protein
MTDLESCLIHVNPKILGFGKPSELTQRMVAMGWIELTTHDDGTWSASLTKSGKAKKDEHFPAYVE